ncbi:hypothetical protein EDB19DRAFT_502416 [Suillus lakei]|nr:hypothetical protein EDB19DRAFT_502416 [Suillus lakei]
MSHDMHRVNAASDCAAPPLFSPGPESGDHWIFFLLLIIFNVAFRMYSIAWDTPVDIYAPLGAFIFYTFCQFVARMKVRYIC